MARCFDVVGYIEQCTSVPQKYTGRAMLIVAKKALPLEFLADGLVLEKINAKTSFKELYNGIQEDPAIKMLPVTIEAENPFGVTVQGNIDSGRVMYTKTIPVSLPQFGNAAEEFIMGLQRGLKGAQALLFLEKNEDGTGFSKNNDTFGAYSPVRLDPASVTKSEYENGGSWNFNLVCDEPVPTVFCIMTEFSATLDILNA